MTCKFDSKWSGKWEEKRTYNEEVDPNSQVLIGSSHIMTIIGIQSFYVQQMRGMNTLLLEIWFKLHLQHEMDAEKKNLKNGR